MKFLIRILVIAIATFGLTYILSGIHADNFGTALGFALALSIIDAIVKPLFIILTLPITIITLGIFLFIVNTIMVLLASKFVKGFWIDSFWWALLFSFLLSFIISLADSAREQNRKDH